MTTMTIRNEDEGKQIDDREELNHDLNMEFLGERWSRMHMIR